ncbi:hypothetical protein [Rickettsia helvetica]|nr:hypothetical protein [Rickettsia helvetica]MCZ6883764.1 hypothetical protein [Rickettsia endosymbiont of Ixodes ricinus]MCZ6896318.1 hypothetical protein [Rickettsia endosymbiont of Ixodes ricinus]
MKLNIDNVALRQGLLSLEQVSKEAKNNNEAIIKGKDILRVTCSKFTGN